jgi:hypothetical protein
MNLVLTLKRSILTTLRRINLTLGEPSSNLPRGAMCTLAELCDTSKDACSKNLLLIV